ncbi:MAG: 4Fe-4S binding protein [Thermoplasmatota archaeon]
MFRLTKETEKQQLELAPGQKVVSVASSFHKPTEILLKSGKHVNSCCVRCKPAFCTRFLEGEIKSNDNGFTGSFPFDTNLAVCPVTAISTGNDGTPIVRCDDCIGCGLCAARCPVGAIHIDRIKRVAVVSRETGGVFVAASGDSGPKETLEHIRSLSRESGPPEISSKFLIDLLGRLQECGADTPNFENHFTRNLLIQLGIPCKMRRVGDQNLRMDLFAEKEGSVLVAEVDFNPQNLVATPRGILDDVAVLHSRHGVELHSIVPIVFCNRFPNKRSDYYEIMKDIRVITGVRPHTVSVCALLVMMLTGTRIKISRFKDVFLVDNEKMDINSDLSSIIRETVTLEGLEDFLSPGK